LFRGPALFPDISTWDSQIKFLLQAFTDSGSLRCKRRKYVVSVGKNNPLFR